MNYKKIINKLNEKNAPVSEFLDCPYCGSIDVAATENIDDTYYYKETDYYYEGQRPIGIIALYICNHCGADFKFTGKLTDTTIIK